jgi:hypothetical protein
MSDSSLKPDERPMSDLTGCFHSVARLVEILLTDVSHDVTDVEYVEALKWVQTGLTRIHAEAICAQSRWGR